MCVSCLENTVHLELLCRRSHLSVLYCSVEKACRFCSGNLPQSEVKHIIFCNEFFWIVPNPVPIQTSIGKNSIDVLYYKVYNKGMTSLRLGHCFELLLKFEDWYYWNLRPWDYATMGPWDAVICNQSIFS